MHGRCFRFLGAFGKLRKETISYVVTVCSYVRLLAWDNSVPIERIFMELGTLIFFKNMSR